MDSGFVHYEVLGVRAGLDEWLTGIQDMGLCHFSDALEGNEGHAGIARPTPGADELRARLMRSEAAHSLRTVSRVLPASPRAPDGSAGGGSANRDAHALRPRWDLGRGASDEGEVSRLREEARERASAIAAGLEALRAAEEQATHHARVRTALRLLRETPEGASGAVRGAAWALPLGARGVRRFVRALARTGLVTRRGRTGKETVVLALGESTADPIDAARLAEAHVAAEAFGAQSVELPEAGSALESALRAAEEDLARSARIEHEARGALGELTRTHGPRARLLLDSIEDAEAREDVWRQLAATEHVVAARVWVPREDRVVFLEQARARFGQSVVLRPLAPAADEPTLPRRVAPVPLEALRGLEPARFGTVGLSALLALFTPIAVGAVWADVAGGLLMLAVGALLGFGAGRGSPRRDTSLLAQVGGLFALLTGTLAGRAFGSAGEVWFGTGWGLAPGFSLAPDHLTPHLRPFVGILQVLGQVAAVFALYGLVLTLRAWRREHVARARLRLLGVLDALTVVGLACAAQGSASGIFFLWVLAPIAAGLALLLEGPGGFLRRYALDQVGVIRLVALPGAALLFLAAAFGALPGATVVEWVLLPLSGLFVLVALLTDPAQVAMGVPSGLGLGGRRFTRPYRPLRRRERTAAKGATA